MPGAVAENKAQETLAVGELEFNQQQLEKQGGHRALSRGPELGGSRGARFQESQ